MSCALFWCGVLMITYDMLGHGLCFVARISGSTGAHIWNQYSYYIFPSIRHPYYDLFWFVFFAVACFLILYTSRTT